MINYGKNFHFINNISVKTGQRTKKTKKIASINNNKINKITSAMIKKVFMNIPSPIATPTNPFLYSFFHGLK